MALSKAQRTLRALAETKKAQDMARFFKTAPGEYGEGDKFLGVSVPDIRSTAKANLDIKDPQLNALLESQYHEERLLGVLILVARFEKGSDRERRVIYRYYLDHTGSINNWDLVDLSAHKIVGAYLLNRSRKPLYRLARSNSLWERRIAVISTFHFIRNNDFEDCLAIADILLSDSHDLIHKAVGWMIRETGNRDLAIMEQYLKPRYKKMPRTMLRYAIEKLPQKQRKQYLKGTV